MEVRLGPNWGYSVKEKKTIFSGVIPRPSNKLMVASNANF
jgi:hypothetical protein